MAVAFNFFENMIFNSSDHILISLVISVSLKIEKIKYRFIVKYIVFLNVKFNNYVNPLDQSFGLIDNLILLFYIFIKYIKLLCSRGS